MPIGRVYKLYDSSDPGQFYVGSTETSIQRRFSHHKSQAHNGDFNTILHRYIREIDPENFYIVFVIDLLEEINFENITELRAREQHYIDLLQPPLNEYRAVSGREIRLEKIIEWKSARVVCVICEKEMARGHLYKHSETCLGENRVVREEKKQQRLKERNEKWRKMMINCVICDNLYQQGSMKAHIKLHEQRNDAAQFAYLW